MTLNTPNFKVQFKVPKSTKKVHREQKKSFITPVQIKHFLGVNLMDDAWI